MAVPLVIGLLSTPSVAKRPKRGRNSEITACVANYKSGLDQERSGRLLEARELFIRCSKTSCGSPLRDECTARFTQLTVEIPSVVPVVTNAAGKTVTNVDVQVDGERLTSSIDGHSFIMNPGEHDFSFSKDGHIFATQSLLIVQGQRNRLVSASLQQSATPPVASSADADGPEKVVPSPPPGVDLSATGTAKEATPGKTEGVDLTARAQPAPKHGIPTLSFVTAGIGVAALGAGALLTYWGRKDNALLDSCSPGCPQSSANHISNLYLAADISFAAGVAALAGSYWAFARSRSNHEEGEEVAVRSTPTILVAPAPSGAVGALSGSF